MFFRSYNPICAGCNKSLCVCKVEDHRSLNDGCRFTLNLLVSAGIAEAICEKLALDYVIVFNLWLPCSAKTKGNAFREDVEKGGSVGNCKITVSTTNCPLN